MEVGLPFALSERITGAAAERGAVSHLRLAAVRAGVYLAINLRITAAPLSRKAKRHNVCGIAALERWAAVWVGHPSRRAADGVSEGSKRRTKDGASNSYPAC